MKSLVKKYREIFIIIIYVLLLAAISYFVIGKIISNINLTIKNIQEKNVDQEIRTSKLQEIPKLKEYFELIQEKEGSTDVFISQDQLIVLIKEIERMAEETGNNIIIEAEQSDPEEIKEQKKQKKKLVDLIDNLSSDNYIKMDISLSGDYESFINFTRRIENIKYWSDIIYLKISTKKIGSARLIDNTSPFQKSPDSEDTNQENNDTRISSVVGIVFYLK